MYGSDKDKDTKLKSLKDLGSKMRELHAHSVKGNSQAMTDSMPNPKKVRNEEDTEDKSEMSHQDREDSKHDDMNEDGMNEESNLESHPSHDSQAMHDINRIQRCLQIAKVWVNLLSILMLVIVKKPMMNMDH